MKQYLFLGDSITDADHLFDPANLGYGYVSLLARRPEYADARFVNRGHEGFTIERVLQMLRRDGIGGHWDAITLLAGVNDIPVELFTSHSRIPLEFSAFYREVLDLLCQHTSTILLLEPFLFDEPAEYSAWHPYIEKESQIIQRSGTLLFCSFYHDGLNPPTGSSPGRSRCDHDRRDSSDATWQHAPC